MSKYILVIIINFGSLRSQQSTPLSANISFSSPIVNMGFLSPCYVDPATVSTVIGGFVNPAAYGRISHLEFDFGMGFARSSTINTEITLIDSSEYNSALVMPLDVNIKDAGGIYGFGFGAKYALVGFGFGFLKPFEFTVGLNGDIIQPISFNQTVVDTHLITNRDSLNRSVPVEMHWSLNVTSQTEINGIGDISLKAKPMFFGAGLSFGLLSIGAGFKITKYSGDGTPFIYAKTTLVANVVGTSPYYDGSLSVTATLSDTIVKINMLNDYDGTRKAFNIGANISLGFLKIGAYYEQGFKTTISGSYSYVTETADLNSFQIESIDTPNIYIQNDSLHQDSVVSATFKITSYDTTASTYGGVTLPGYKALGVGLSLGVINAFAGGSIPQKGELNFAYIGAFLRAPLPHFSLRAGASVSARYFYTDKKEIIPLGIAPYVGIGASIPLNIGSLPFGPTLGLPLVIDLSAKSNVLSLMGKIIENMVNNSTFEVTGTPNPLKTLSLGVALRVRM